MNSRLSPCRAALVGLFLAGLPVSAPALLITTNTLIDFKDKSYDGLALVVSNCTLTVDGQHLFSSLQLQSGAVLTHTYAPSGVLEDRSSITGERQTLSGTNGTFLASSNIIVATMVVQDLSGAITYTNGLDYTVSASSNQMTLLARTDASAIPDGATVLVSYEVLNAAALSGLSINVTGAVRIGADAAVRVDARGYSAGPGAGGSQNGVSGSGGGGGHGGYGGISLSNAPGGMSYGYLAAANTKGSGGGNLGGIGGGSVEISSTVSLEILGTISANGAGGVHSRSGGGAGGGIFLNAPLLTGSGRICADGGNGEPSQGGGGGGGRISLRTTTNLFAGTITARGGGGVQAGGAGTVYVTDAVHFNGVVTVDNGSQQGGVTGVGMRPSGVDLVVQAGARAEIGSYNTALRNLTVSSNAWVTLAPGDTVTVVIASNAVFAAGSGIDLNGLGYSYGQGLGPGRVTVSSPYVGGSGGGHGGYGGLGLAPSGSGATTGPAPGGTFYGSLLQPVDCGSGGGGSSIYPGGAGGGAVRLTVQGALVLDGSILANGADSPSGLGGAGAGGSIWVVAGSLSGAGSMSANGGSAGAPYGGGGAGGRIAVYCASNAFTGAITAQGGTGYAGGAAGTIYRGAQQGGPGLLLVDNGGLLATNTPLGNLAFGKDVTVQGSSVVSVAPASLGRLTIRSNSSLLPRTDLLACTNLVIEAGGAVAGDGLGYAANQGPNRGFYVTTGLSSAGGGGGHGGAGGNGFVSGANGGPSAQDYLATPSIPGSGGGALYGLSNSSLGGGVFRVLVAGATRIDGKISVNGLAGLGSGSGGGAGGSIQINTYSLAGQGVISADGGAGSLPYGGGGGGGRIAIGYTSNSFTGALSARGGAGNVAGGAGTVFLKSTYDTVAKVIVDNGGLVGTNSLPFGAGNVDLTVIGGAWISWGPLYYRNIFIGSNSWLRPYTPSETWTITGNLTIEAGGAITADGLGSPYPIAPGSGTWDLPTLSGGGGASAGYGGAGIGANARGGVAPTAYLASSPASSGYGGGFQTYGSVSNVGGSALRLEFSRGILTVNGRLSANGSPGLNGGGGGGGGSLWINGGTLAGNGIIAANGGSGSAGRGGGGGGGRVAVYCSTNRFTGQITALGGAGYRNGGAGTVYFKLNQANYGTVTVDNAGLPGTNTWLGLEGQPRSVVDLVLGGGAVVVPSRSFSPSLPPSLYSFTVSSCLVGSNATLLLSNSTMTVTSNLTVSAGGRISADGQGYRAGQGPGAGRLGGGGNHGGLGGGNLQSGSDSFSAPRLMGSGGGNAAYTSGGSGGGVANIGVLGALRLDGEISADGTGGSYAAGGGAGGSVVLSAASLSGSGVISANGGSGGFGAGGGGGGMIAATIRTNQFAGLITAYGGAGIIGGGAGTIYSRNTTKPLQPAQLVVDNGGLAGALTVLTNPASADLAILNRAAVAARGGPWWVNNLDIGPGSSLAASGELVPARLDLAVLGSARIESGSRLSLDSLGYRRDSGPGAGKTASGLGAGGGYGGPGGASPTAPGGAVYGSAEAPVDGGSGGGSGSSYEMDGSQGGGALRLTVGNTLTADGAISSDGNAGVQDDAAGGAGGSLWITASRIEGAGRITAAGGAGEVFDGGGGGGGRIALAFLTNNFAGFLSAPGGWGSMPGSFGTVFMSSAPGLSVASQTPAGIVSNAVGSVTLSFNTAPNPASIASAAITLMTPWGPMPANNLTITPASTVDYIVAFPPQTAPGDYTLKVGPGMQALAGAAMSQAYTGVFTIALPVIQGTILQTNGTPAAGVTLAASDSGSLFVTDPNGRYSVGAAPGSTFHITPMQAGQWFVPATRWYTNVTASLSGQDFRSVSALAPTMSAGVQGSGLSLSCFGIAGVNYQLTASSNLVDWVPVGDWFVGANGPIQWTIPAGTDPSWFFRLTARN